jgi:hypothetical protein
VHGGRLCGLARYQEVESSAGAGVLCLLGSFDREMRVVCFVDTLVLILVVLNGWYSTLHVLTSTRCWLLFMHR